MADGALIVDILDVLNKTYGKGISAEAQKLNHSNHMRPADGGAFVLPS